MTKAAHVIAASAQSQRHVPDLEVHKYNQVITVAFIQTFATQSELSDIRCATASLLRCPRADQLVTTMIMCRGACRDEVCCLDWP